ncbi:MAG: hypothetical protein LBK94_06695 [Prevotellaceae bacterium]|jgi:hypothetical protein|nr:hypothetical protein [Prevotellaceae bacterium]
MKKKNNNPAPDNNKTDEMRKQNDAFAAEAFEMFYSAYPPAADISEAIRFFTTDEIAKTVQDIFPTATIDKYMLTLFLKQSGYKSIAMHNEFNPCFKWMIK